VAYLSYLYAVLTNRWERFVSDTQDVPEGP
jgi:hypothetical protein